MVSSLNYCYKIDFLKYKYDNKSPYLAGILATILHITSTDHSISNTISTISSVFALLVGEEIGADRSQLIGCLTYWNKVLNV